LIDSNSFRALWDIKYPGGYHYGNTNHVDIYTANVIIVIIFCKEEGGKMHA